MFGIEWVVCLVVMLCVIRPASSYGYIKTFSISNLTENQFRFAEAEFGSSIPEGGLMGILWLAVPVNACVPVKIPASPIIYSFNNFLLIEESSSQKTCSYSKQLLHAQHAGYSAGIVYSRSDTGNFVTMEGDGPVIPSVFVTKYSGNELKKYIETTDSRIELILVPEFPLKLYLIPFLVVVSLCFFFMVVFSFCRYLRYRLRQRRSRLSSANLRKIPTKRFKKGDEYDMCAICIEEYQENEKLRILPCNHAYHCKCVDPWLISGKKLCPVCKQTVEPNKEANKESLDGSSSSSHYAESEPATEGYEDATEESMDENTPLLSGQPNATFSGSVGV